MYGIYVRGMGCREGRPRDNFIRAVIATQNVARLRSELENEPDEFTRSRLRATSYQPAQMGNCCCFGNVRNGTG
jgi:hypothetical protein